MNIEILKTGIDVTPIKQQLDQYASDWDSQRKIEKAESMLDRGWMEIDTGVLQLVIGYVTDPKQFVGDTEFCQPTPAFYHHSSVIGFLMANGFQDYRRCGFLSIPVGSIVGTHIDEGKYYLDKDRFHLSIQGTYAYTVGDETVIVEPGTLLVFNNKVPHGTVNLGNEPRITFVFDVPNKSWDKKLYSNCNWE